MFAGSTKQRSIDYYIKVGYLEMWEIVKGWHCCEEVVWNDSEKSLIS